MGDTDQQNNLKQGGYLISSENIADPSLKDNSIKDEAHKHKKKKFDTSILFQPVFDPEFDPNSKYQVTSKYGAIKDWQDLLVVLLVVALSVMAFTAILIRYEILANPFNAQTRYDLTNVYVSGSNQILDQLIIDYPLSGNQVEGVVNINGRITGNYVGLLINIYDENNNKLGSAEVLEFSEIDGVKYYQTTVFIEHSPQSTSGNITISTVSSTTEQVPRDISANVNVFFSSTKLEDGDTYLNSPIPFQLSSKDSQLRFWGHTEKYANSQLGLELRESKNDATIAKFTIEANIDGDIIKEISLVGINGIGDQYKSGKWVLISPSGEVITEIPVLFDKTY